MWQPIATAPRDGTDILLFMPDLGGSMIVACYDRIGVSWWHTLDGIRYHKDAPTHWMELPAPPVTGACP